MPYAAVNDVQTTLRHKHVLARNMVATVHHETCGEIKLINTPIKYSDSTPGIRTAPPLLGEHTHEVLGSLLGLDRKEIEGLQQVWIKS
jgi:succinate--hydroxymethylglutarate CoA-transferase